MTPSAFIFLYENQLFLTFRNRTVAVWNFRGELVTSFEDHLLWHPDCNTNNIYITSDQDLIISYCKADSDDPLSEGNGTFPFLSGPLFAFLGCLSVCNTLSIMESNGRNSLKLIFLVNHWLGNRIQLNVSKFDCWSICNLLSYDVMLC